MLEKVNSLQRVINLGERVLERPAAGEGFGLLSHFTRVSLVQHVQGERKDLP